MKYYNAYNLISPMWSKQIVVLVSFLGLYFDVIPYDQNVNLQFGIRIWQNFPIKLSPKY